MRGHLRARRMGVSINTHASGGTGRTCWKKALKGGEDIEPSKGLARTVSVAFVLVMDPIAISIHMSNHCRPKRGKEI